MILGTETVTVVRYADSRDAFGDLPANVVPLDTDIPGCNVQPASSTEQTAQRETVVTLFTAWLPAGSDVRATDQLRWRGSLYNVDSLPEPWADIQGADHHLELRIRRVEG